MQPDVAISPHETLMMPFLNTLMFQKRHMRPLLFRRNYRDSSLHIRHKGKIRFPES
jgi:hypothetical protein